MILQILTRALSRQFTLEELFDIANTLRDQAAGHLQDARYHSASASYCFQGRCAGLQSFALFHTRVEQLRGILVQIRMRLLHLGALIEFVEDQPRQEREQQAHALKKAQLATRTEEADRLQLCLGLFDQGGKLVKGRLSGIACLV